MMKKKYIKPNVVCQELHPETLLCTGACNYRNTDFNEAQQCGFTPPDLGFRIFAQGWVDCFREDPTDLYCYHNGTINLFGS